MSAAVAPSQPTERRLEGTPFVGLVPYGEGDAAFFFGREEEKQIVAGNLRAARLTILYGASGVGKSSLLHAGVVHDLHEQVRVNAAAGARTPFAICAFSTWRDDPLPALAGAMRAACIEALGEELPAWRPGEPLVGALRGWTARVRPLLVVLDQFEDYFLYHPDEDGEGTFAVELPRIVNELNLRVNIVLSLREDALAKLDRFKGRIPGLFSNYVRVEHLSRAEAREAIEGPVEEWNRRLGGGGEPYAVEPALVAAVIDAAAAGKLGLGEGGDGGATATASADGVEAPFLQLVLDRLWRATVEAGEHTLDVARLEALGGAAKIVENHLLEALGKLTPAEQAVAADLFRFLVTRSKTKIAHPASDLAEWTGRPEPEVSAVLEQLCRGESGRILRSVAATTGGTAVSYELFHDVLAAPVLEWRSRFVLDQEREAEAHRRRVIRRRLVLIGLGLLCLVLVLAGFTGWAVHERSNAQHRADIAESQALAARSLRAQSLDPRGSLDLAARAEDTSATPQAEEALRRALVAWPKPTALVAPGRTTYGVDFSPDSRFVVTAGGGGALVRTTSGQLVATLIAHRLVISARFSPDGRYLVTATDNGAIRLWRVDGWRELPSTAHILSGLLARAAFSADGKYIVAGGFPGWPNQVWPFDDGRIGRRLTPGSGVAGWIEPDGTSRVVDRRTADSADALAEDAPFAAASTGDGRRLVVPDGLEATKVFRTATRRPAGSFTPAVAAVFSPNGAALATEGDNIVIWNLARNRPTAVLPGAASGAAFSRDGTLLVGASTSQAVARIWDARSGALVAELPPRPPRYHREVVLPNPYPFTLPLTSGPPPPHQVAVGTGPGPAFELGPAATFSPDGNLVATWGRDGRGASLWQPLGTRLLASLRARSDAADEPLLLPVAVSADGALVATAGRDNQVEVWTARDGRLVSTLRGNRRFVSSIAFDPDGALVATAGFDGAVRLWRVEDGRLLHTLQPRRPLPIGRGRIGAVAFSPDGKLLASAGEDGTATVRRVDTGKTVTALSLGNSTANGVSFSRDGRSLVTAGGDGVARVWSTDDWKQSARLAPKRPSWAVLGASFSPDGHYVATLDRDAKARIWHSTGGPPIRVVSNVGSIAFSPDGNELIAGGGNATARVFRIADGKQTGLLRGHTNTVSGARYGQAGDLIVTAGLDGTARVWEAATGGTVAVLRPSPSPVVDAWLVADGSLVAVSKDGVRLYACDACLDPAELRAAAAARLK